MYNISKNFYFKKNLHSVKMFSLEYHDLDITFQCFMTNFEVHIFPGCQNSEAMPSVSAAKDIL